jgi:hypothetical protein
VKGPFKHGARGRTGTTTEYKIWCGIITRCTNPRSAGFARYGGRDITICPRWRASFSAFLEDVGARPSRGHSIDRIDNDRGYEPGNVRWVTNSEQQRNRGNNHLLTIAGRTQPLAAWCEETGIGHSTIIRRLRLGWSGESLVSPVQTKFSHAGPRGRRVS